ncbi:MAG: DNA-directed RNA polymerase subunit B [Nanoarchaeota archaeon]
MKKAKVSKTKKPVKKEAVKKIKKENVQPKASKTKAKTVEAKKSKTIAQPKMKTAPIKSEPTDIFFNGKFISDTKEPEKFINDLRKKRRMNLIPHQLNVSYYSQFNEIRINTGGGRARRPLIIIENGKPRLTEMHVQQMLDNKLTWEDLVKKSLIEYLDADEEENAYVALEPNHLTSKHTHMEINPVVMLGISSTFIPYPEYNRGDRVNYGVKMIGQAIGFVSSNFLTRMDTKFNLLAYPQKPILYTDTSTILEKYPGGQNIVVAIMCHDGFNLNDAIVLNKSAVERGLFRSYYFRTYETIKKRYWGGQEDEVMIPEPGIKGHRGEEAYADISEDGIINLETKVTSDSVIIGKVSPLRFLSDKGFTADIENKRETSVTVRYGEGGIIDEVIVTETPDGNRLYKIRIRDERQPELGDKFASRHGQKGVLGLLVPQEDMPFTNNGVTPDIIFNPHAIPSRMTIGQLLELIGAKTAALSGKDLSATAFNHMKEGEIRGILKKIGFRDDGKEMLYDGKTGKIYKVLIFTGLSYYMKLDHMVANKIHARSRGPVTLLTKQPTEGRAKRGGLRIGEMEQQCLLGHGAALTLKERFDSDKTSLPICKKCGLIATLDVLRGKIYCGSCKSSEVVWINTSYAFKLTLDELKAMNVYPKIILGEE